MIQIKKNQIFARSLLYLKDFIKEAFIEQIQEKKEKPKRVFEGETRQSFDYIQNKKKFIRFALSSLTINDISKFFNPSEFRKLKRMLKQDESIKELLPREIYFNLFELTPMEQETKKLLEKGLTRKEIAQILCVEEESVKIYNLRIRRKQGLPIREFKKKDNKNS